MGGWRYIDSPTDKNEHMYQILGSFRLILEL